MATPKGTTDLVHVTRSISAAHTCQQSPIWTPGDAGRGGLLTPDRYPEAHSVASRPRSPGRAAGGGGAPR
jgi:hypothetical protein